MTYGILPRGSDSLKGREEKMHNCEAKGFDMAEAVGIL